MMMNILNRLYNLLRVEPEQKQLKLSEDDMELLTELYKVNRPVYEIAAAIDKSETRVKYEIAKLDREADDDDSK